MTTRAEKKQEKEVFKGFVGEVKSRYEESKKLNTTFEKGTFKYRNVVSGFEADMAQRFADVFKQFRMYEEVEGKIKDTDEAMSLLYDLSVGIQKTNFEQIEHKHKRKVKEGSKRKISGYNLYAREMFPEIKDNNPGTLTKDLLVLIGAGWKALSKDQQADYKERAEDIEPSTKEEKDEKKKGYAKKANPKPKKTEEEKEEAKVARKKVAVPNSAAEVIRLAKERRDSKQEEQPSKSKTKAIVAKANTRKKEASSDDSIDALLKKATTKKKATVKHASASDLEREAERRKVESEFN